MNKKRINEIEKKVEAAFAADATPTAKAEARALLEVVFALLRADAKTR